jgi:hypothetical protein
LTAARDTAAVFVGQEQAAAMVSARPLAIVNNERVEVAPVFI